jgi:hypothetical protein
MRSFRFYSSPNIVWISKSRRMRWTRYMACTGDRRGAYTDFERKPEGKRSHGRRRHGNIILKWTLKKYDGRATGLILLRIGITGMPFRTH